VTRAGNLPKPSLFWLEGEISSEVEISLSLTDERERRDTATIRRDDDIEKGGVERGAE